MSYQAVQGKLAAYGKIGVEADVTVASPHKIIDLLMVGALDKIAIAKGHMARGGIAESGKNISLAISIIDGLRFSLDHNIESEIPGNLERLYDYMTRTLVEANAKKNIDKLDEVANLLREIKSAWEAIPEEAKAAHQNKDQYLAAKG